MTLLHDRRFASWARGHLLCRVADAAGVFALTFDDGPNPHATPQVLDVLGRYGARATFFTLAPRVHREPALLRRIPEAGHEVAAHGDWHWPLPLLPPWAIRHEVLHSIQAVTDAGVVRPRFYRPPFGFMMPGQAAFVRRMGVEPVLGDIYPEDVRHPGTEVIARRVTSRLRAGSIVILHDGSALGAPSRQQTIDALGVILDHARAMGLASVTLSELAPQPLPHWRFSAGGAGRS